MRFPGKSIAFLAAVAAGTVASQAPAAVLTFEAAGEYDANFRKAASAGEVVQTNNGAGGNDFLQKSGQAVTSLIYDLTPTPGDAPQNTFPAPVTVTFDVRMGDVGSSVGVFVINPTNEASAVLALFNVDSATGGGDLIRFFTGASATDGGAGNQADAASGDAGITAGGAAFIPVTVTYSVSGTTPTMTMNVGGFSDSFTFAAGTAINSPEIGLRLFDIASGGTVDVDNFNIVPEPTTAALLLPAAAGVLGWRRRR